MLNYSIVLIILLFGVNFNSLSDNNEGLAPEVLLDIEIVETVVFHMSNIESKREITQVNSCMEIMGEDDKAEQGVFLPNGAIHCDGECSSSPCCAILTDPEED